MGRLILILLLFIIGCAQEENNDMVKCLRVDEHFNETNDKNAPMLWCDDKLGYVQLNFLYEEMKKR